MKIVIVGNGIAGNHAALKIRQINRDHEICIVSAEGVPEYDPCTLPYFVGGDVQKHSVFRKKPEEYEQWGIDLVLDNRVESIDAVEKFITTEKGLKIGYDKLVLAHGGGLFIPPIEGVQMKGVFSCKQLSEAEALKAHTGAQAVVIGSGAIGIEVAEALTKKGYQVAVIELLDWILPALFDRETADRIEAGLSKFGVQSFTSEKVLAIEGKNEVEAVITDKRTIPCDTVVIATGVIPGAELAREAGVITGRGIKVNEYMQTNISDIYACGDCVETFDACTGEDAMFQLKHNAIDQATIVAANILGEQAMYTGAYAFARVHFGRTHAATFGKTTVGTKCELGELEIVEQEETGGYLRLILKENVIVGGQAIGGLADYIGFFLSAMRRRDDFSHLRKSWPGLRKAKSYQSWHKRLMGEVIGLY